MLPTYVKIVEVGPRDGLQNEKKLLSTADKIKFVKDLTDTGLKYIEIGSFVSEKSVPQMHDTDSVIEGIDLESACKYSVLVPNDIGANKVIKYTGLEMAVFTSASEKFCQKNINCSISESMRRFKSVMDIASNKNIPVRGYVSCVLGCPYEGDIEITKVVDLVVQLIDLGCYEVSLGDTIGIGNIKQVRNLIASVSAKTDINKIAVHFHDTLGQALVNVYAALEMGVNIVDSSVAGLGGCPYAKGSSGNLATEDLIYMLNGLDIQSGVDLNKLIKVGHAITNKLGILPRSKVSLAKL